MGQFYLTCNWCYDNFNDCGPYIQCNCGRVWCTDDCAKEDKLKYYNCPRSCEFCEKECQGEEVCHKTFDCEMCELKKFCSDEDGNPTSCSYCRGENIDDDKLLEFILKTIHITREQAIKLYNKEVEK